ncbi:cyclodeaminase/cyclohydrolase family protein [Halomonas sp. M20]|uniref:cyclodeaminase/cyclohydrolase family protein n=1 Tax=Halomonas sp. M20 TaxID=2763264 RepID=UPI001D0ACCF0|nr:cyclodeaminase/cyclohydrolase family protein [Halomonas sp. M20]
MGSQVWTMSLESFRNTTIKHATPGCGAVAAVTATHGLALILKGLRISESKHPDDKRAALIDEGETLLERLSGHADEDIQAFEAYQDALKQRHNDKDEQAGLDEATQRINRVPLAMAETCCEALKVTVSSLTYTNSNLKSDAIAGGVLLHAGLSAVLLTVDANLASIEDETYRAQMRRSRHALQEEADGKIHRLNQERDNL